MRILYERSPQIAYKMLLLSRRIRQIGKPTIPHSLKILLLFSFFYHVLFIYVFFLGVFLYFIYFTFLFLHLILFHVKYTVCMCDTKQQTRHVVMTFALTQHPRYSFMRGGMSPQYKVGCRLIYTLQTIYLTFSSNINPRHRYTHVHTQIWNTIYSCIHIHVYISSRTKSCVRVHFSIFQKTTTNFVTISMHLYRMGTSSETI